MGTQKIKNVILAASIVGAGMLAPGSAFAACTFSEWDNVTPNHALPHITTQLCDGEMTVNVIGADPSGQTFDFGWSVASLLPAGGYSTEIVDANARNQLEMTIDPGAETMHVAIETTLTGGGSSASWVADYALTGTHD